jgi:dihydroorotate dehydrogenase (NAD+) catalytic subunit
MMLAGADLVSVGTALFTDPYTPVKVTEGIKDYLERKNILSAEELTGRVLLN